jgi:hypothetical protein
MTWKKAVTLLLYHGSQMVAASESTALVFSCLRLSQKFSSKKASNHFKDSCISMVSSASLTFPIKVRALLCWCDQYDIPYLGQFLTCLVGAYYHEHFVRGNRELCLQITRIKAPPSRRLSPKAIEQQQDEAIANTPLFSLQSNRLSPSRDTTEWLISAGVPFSTLDPHPVALMGGGNKNASIYDWAEEITSIFSQVSVSHQKSMARKHTSAFADSFDAYSFDSTQFHSMGNYIDLQR